MTEFSEYYAKRVRRAILELMVEDGGHGNDGTLVTALRSMGHRAGVDQQAVRQLMRDLAERDCISTEIVRDTVMVGAITERGRMVVAGDINVSGVEAANRGL
jgi:hypothetical protein